MTSFRFNHAELNRLARERWGLRWPVRMKRRPRRFNQVTQLWSLAGWGWHCAWWDPKTDERWHEIRVANQSLEATLSTLAHELEHARMNEAIGVQTHAYLYNGFGPAAKRLGWRRGPAAPQQGAFEARCVAASGRWQELLPCVRFPKMKETT